LLGDAKEKTGIKLTTAIYLQRQFFEQMTLTNGDNQILVEGFHRLL